MTRDAVDFGRRLVLILLVAAPLAYASTLVATVVHEVIGHGLASVLCGGPFPRVVIDAGGDGGALIEDDNLKGHEFVVLAAGVVAEWVVGGAFAVAARRSDRVFRRLVYVVLAACLLDNAGMYAFWGCMVPGPPDDFGRIAEMLGGPRTVAGATLATGTGLAWIVGEVVVWRLAFRWIEDVLGPLSRRQARALFACLVAFVSASWLLLGCNEATQLSDFAPCAVGVGLDACILALLCERRRTDVVAADVPIAAWRRAIFVSWAASAAVATTILVAFRD